MKDVKKGKEKTLEAGKDTPPFYFDSVLWPLDFCFTVVPEIPSLPDGLALQLHSV